MTPTQRLKPIFKFIFLTFYLTAVVLHVVYNMSVFEDRKNLYYDQKIQALSISYKNSVNTYELLALSIYEETLNTEPVLSLFKDAKDASPEAQHAIRNQLYDLLGDNYDRYGLLGIRQLHFHLPNNTSFLRFHKPDKFGDDLTDARYSVSTANRDLHKVSGFEEGRIFNGFRNVFPLFYQFKHIGSVEISTSFRAIRNQLQSLFDKDFGILIKRSVVEDKLFPEVLSNYQTSDIYNTYLYDAQILSDQASELYMVSPDIRKTINSKMGPDIWSKMDRGEPAVYYCDLNDSYLVTFIPVKNIEGHVVSYIIAYEEDFFLAKEITLSKFRMGVGVLIITIIFGFILLLYHQNFKYRQQKQVAESANRAKDSFLATMSHEIRTPLNAIIGLTRLIESPDLRPSQMEYLSTIRGSGESLTLIINDILDFSKIEANKLDLETVPFDIRETVEKVIDLLASKAHSKDVEVKYLINKQVPFGVIGDPLRISQILINLINNAIKFTEKGEIFVSTELISETKTTATLKFSVKDTGVGITAEVLPKLFKAFSQADNSTTRKYGGTGLGLAISAKLAKMMNGNIEASNNDESGSTFEFSIQIKKQEKENSLIIRHTPKVLLGKSVLLFSTDPTTRYILETYFTQWGFQVILSASVHETTELLKARDTDIHLLLIDTEINKSDKFDVLIELATDHPHPTPIIQLAQPDQLEDLLENNWNLTTLPKPIKPSLVFTTVVNVLLGDSSPSSKDVASITPQDKLSQSLRREDIHVLLAEDNPTNQLVARELLKKQGYEVHIVGNGQEAVSQYRTGNFNIILMDCQMPVLDGYEATQAIRELETDHHIPIIAMTADAMIGTREKCIAAGMDEYISKPFDAEKLASLIDGLAKS